MPSVPGYPNACRTCGATAGRQCVSLTKGLPTDTHVARMQPVPLEALPVVERQREPERGIELPFARRVYQGMEWDGPRVPKPQYSVRFGMAFVSRALLEELLEADNSWGGEGATLIHDPDAQAALECAGLIHVETKGGVYTDNEQRRKINKMGVS